MHNILERRHMSDFTTAFGEFDGLVRSQDPASFFLVANNPDLNLAELASILDPERDYVCQFNKCMFAKDLSGLATRFMFFSSTDENGIPRGFSWDGLPTKEVCEFPAGSTGFILKYRESPRPPFLGEADVHELPNIRLTVIDAEMTARAVADLPSQHLPSAGFTATTLFTLINYLRLAHGRKPHRIVLVGFTGQYHGGSPFVHDFGREQLFYRTNPFVSSLGGSASPTEKTPPADQIALDTLRNRFSDRYDFTSASKAQILTDISEVFYKTGDMTAFQRLINAAISVNPSVAARQIGLLVRSLIAEEAQELPSPFLSKVVAESDSRARDVNDKWKLGKIQWAPVKNPDVASANCEYKLRSTDAPRVLILNETSKIGFNDKHLGCHNVSKTIADKLAENGMEYAGWANNIGGFNEILEVDEGRDFDAVIINGEGTFHSNAARAIELSMIGQYAKTLGKKVFLINTVWERNGRHLEEMCSGFDLITARESWSFRGVKNFAREALLVPDLAWNCAEPATNSKTDECGVIDCILPETTALLQELALTNSLEFRTMSGLLRPFAKSVQQSYPIKSVPSALSEADLTRFGSWISGRFHGLILGLVHRSSVAAFQSNTSKIQAMLQDIGIAHKICSIDDIQQSTENGRFTESLQEKLEYSSLDWVKVSNYREFAIAETRKTFERIREMV
ncbi:hypothetical protein GOC60_05160 [Sinorhizobium meliloti]|nr:hypothetical protein [Sinorhizobium meliloti]MDX0260594.1 hypothetical protein [Sinorhizobium meliloti]MDX0347711.1 hypothetical protein [Sinorhizobium meliloti]